MKKFNLLITGLFLMFQFSLSQNVVTIDSIQSTISSQDSSAFVDSTVVTSGLVTGVTKDTTAFFLQNGDSAWNGIYVYDADSTQLVQRGDSISLTGVVKEFFGLTEIVNISSLTVYSSGNTLPNPALISTNDATQEPYEGVLVKVRNATCTADSNQFGEWPVNDGSGSVLIDDLIRPYGPTVNATYHVTGPVYYSFGSFKIEPRDTDDIELISLPPASFIPIDSIQSTMSGQDSSAFVDSTIVTAGIVTGITKDTAAYFIQDGDSAWNGLYVFDPGNAPTLNRGDSVTLKGTIKEFFGMTEMTSVSSLTLHSSGNPLPNPAGLSTNAVNQEAFESVLVRVQNATCLKDTGKFGEWEVDDGSGKVVVEDLIFGYDPTIGYEYMVTGPVYYSFGEYKIEPRDTNDIVVTDSSGAGITRIYEIQSSTVSSTNDTSTYIDSAVITTTGIVTGITKDTAAYFIQDGDSAWNGLYVFDPGNAASLNRGDSITLSGQITEFYSMTELTSVSGLIVHATGRPLPKPANLSTNAVNQEAFEAVLVGVQSATCIQDTGKFGEWEVDDGSGKVVVEDLIFGYDPTVNTVYNVRGPVYFSFGDYKIEPRDINDIDVLGTDTSNYVSIQTIQSTLANGDTSAYMDSVVTTSGTITGLTNEAYFIQNGTGGWSGLYVYDPTNAPSLNRGDSVSVTGTVVEFFGMTELSYVASVVTHSSGNTVLPLDLSTNGVNQEKYESVLVQVKNATCIQDTGKFGEWQVDDGSGPVVVEDLIFGYDPDVGKDYHVAGPVYFSFGDYKIEPRDNFDVTELTGIDKVDASTIQVYPNPAADKLYIRINDVGAATSTVRLMDMKGQVVHQKEGKGNEMHLSLGHLQNGVYILMIQNEAAVYRKKIVISE